MKNRVLFLLCCISFLGFSQEDEARMLAEKQANNYVYEANGLLNEDFVAAEMAYRKALSKQSNNIAGMYNLGNSYYETGNFEEALYRHQQTAKLATSKAAKHKAFHNMGNVLMQNKNCKAAVEAYKSALRNAPSDDETRYNLAIAKECAKQQEDEEKKDKKENKDEKKNEGPSEYAKMMKKKADDALILNDFVKAHSIMKEALSKDGTTKHFEDYINRLEVITKIVK